MENNNLVLTEPNRLGEKVYKERILETILRPTLKESNYSRVALGNGGDTPELKGGYPSFNTGLHAKKGKMNHPSFRPLDFSYFEDNFDLTEIFSRIVSEFDPDTVLCMTIPDEFKYELMRVIQALIYWELTPGEKIYTKEEILRGSLLQGTKFTARLKDEWEFGVRATHRVPVAGRTYSEWRKVEHYNQLPPVQYLINWRESPDDYKYMEIPVGEMPLLEEFKETFRGLLPEDFEMPTQDDILCITKNSVSLDLSSRRKIPFYKARTNPEGSKFSRIFKAQRTLVPVGAGNTRDTVVTTIDTFNSVSMVDKITLRILNTVEESVVHESSSIFNKKLLKASTKVPRWIYYLRDIKKCGLTFPRELFHAMQEVLSEEYPDKDFSYFDIYRNYSVFMEDWTQINTQRGYCLGMANNLVTLSQCVLFRMIQERNPGLPIRGIFGNDDSILSFKEDEFTSYEEACISIEYADSEICEGLQIMKHNEKSFWSVWPIFFEEYGHPAFKDKDSRLAMSLSSAKLAPTIKIAKCIVNSLTPLYKGKRFEEKILNDIISHFGYEYYPEERDYSYSLGGWYTHLKDGCDLSLREIYNVTDSRLICSLARAHQSVKQFDNLLCQTPRSDSNKGETYSLLGKKYQIWVSDPEFDTKILPYSAINLSKTAYEKFYQQIFNLSRDIINGFNLAESRFKPVRIPQESISIEDLRLQIFSDNQNNLAIPKEMVLDRTSSYTTDYVDIQPPNPVLKREIGVREIMHLGEKLRCGLPIDTDAPPNLDGAGITELPKSRKEFFSVKVHEDCNMDMASILQFNANPNIPLMEYIRTYDYCPVSIVKLFDTKQRERDWRLNKFNIQNLRDLRWCLSMIDIIPDYEIDEALAELRLLQDFVEQQTDEKPDIVLCDSHQISITSGIDNELNHINVIDIDCTICGMLQALFRSKNLSVHDEDPEKRAIYMALLPGMISNARSLILEIGHDPEEIWCLREEAPDIFDLDSEGSNESGGVFSMFD